MARQTRSKKPSESTTLEPTTEKKVCSPDAITPNPNLSKNSTDVTVRDPEDVKSREVTSKKKLIGKPDINFLANLRNQIHKHQESLL